MLKLEAQQGIDHVIATPHFYAKYDDPEKFLERRAAAERALRAEMAKIPGLPTLSVGAEVYYFRGMSESEILSDLTFGEKSCILLEMPAFPWAEYMLQEIEQIHRRRGITPIVAHIDRYVRPFHTLGIPQKLSQMPVLVQANAEFFLQHSTRAMALRMLRRDQIQLLGSDCHNMSDRAPNLGEAYQLIEKKLGLGKIQYVDQCGAHLL